MSFITDMFGGSTESTTEPWRHLQGPLKDMYNLTRNGLNNLQDYYPYQTYANLTPLQEASQFGAMDYAQNYYMPAAMGFQQQLGQYMDAPLNISQDPAVKAMMAANKGEVTDWLRETAIPATTTSAVRSGGLGGSRQGIAQGLAVGKAADALSRANANTMMGAYGTASNLAGNAAGLFGNALNMGFTPSQVAGNIGGQYQNLVNQGINESMTRYGYPEDNLFNRLGQASGIYNGSVNNFSQNEGSDNSETLKNLAGTAATIFGLFSDRRLKKNIRPIGNRGTKFNWYIFEYKNPEYGEGSFIGVMADEVEKIKPSAVKMMPNGYKAVNYGAL